MNFPDLDRIAEHLGVSRYEAKQFMNALYSAGQRGQEAGERLRKQILCEHDFQYNSAGYKLCPKCDLEVQMEPLENLAARYKIIKEGAQ